MNDIESMDKNLKRLLPLGSVVRLKDATHRVMITAYFVKFEKGQDKDTENPENDKNMNEADGKIYDYLGVYWPEGDVDSRHKIMFSNEIIDDVYFYGYSNDVFNEYQKLMINNVKKNQ